MDTDERFDMKPVLIPYQPRWRHDGESSAAAVAAALGDRALRVDHIGSTAVPGLTSKDVIDLQVTVADLEPSGELVVRLEPLGFTFRPHIACDHIPPWAHAGSDWEKRYFVKSPPQRAHLHVRAHGTANQRYALLFRDYLRATPAASAAYATFKEKLALADLDYVDVKDSFCDVVILAAEAWVEQVGWKVS